MVNTSVFTKKSIVELYFKWITKDSTFRTQSSQETGGSACTGLELTFKSSQTGGSDGNEGDPDAGPVFEEGRNPFLLLAQEVGFGVKGSLEEDTSTEWTLLMCLLRSHYEAYLSIERTEDIGEVTFGDESTFGIGRITGSFRLKHGFASVFLKISPMACEIQPYSLVLIQRKTIPSSVISEMNWTHKELNEKALGKGDQADRIDAVRPSLKRITDLLHPKGHPRATTKLIGGGAAGWAVVTYDLEWCKVYRFYGLIRVEKPIPADIKNN